MTELLTPVAECPEGIVLGVPFMDYEHAVFFRLYRDLAAAVAMPSDDDNRLFACRFRALILFARVHFDHEERAMRELGISGFRDHKRGHDTWLRDAEDFVTAIEEAYDRFGCWALTRYVRRWLERHINQHDRSLAAFLRHECTSMSDLLATAFDLSPSEHGGGVSRVACLRAKASVDEPLLHC